MTNGADDVDEDTANRVLEKKRGRKGSRRSGRPGRSGTAGTSEGSETSVSATESGNDDGSSETAGTSGTAGSEGTSGASETSGTDDPWQQPLKDLENVSFYVTEAFKEEALGLTQDMVNVKYRQEFGQTLEKNREFRPLLLELGMEAIQDMDAEEIRDRFEESDRLTDAPIADDE